MEIAENTPDQVAWRCVDGPADWQNTEIMFSIKPSANGETTLLFSHAGWREPTEFMNHCSIHWASYLIGLKAGLEGGDYTPFPQGEVSRWGVGFRYSPGRACALEVNKPGRRPRHVARSEGVSRERRGVG
jgi:hypothetical protein